jgi:TolA-binding protein
MQSHPRIHRLFALLLGSLALLTALSPLSATPEQEAAQSRQIDFANSLFVRKIYDMAAVEYSKFVSGFPDSASREYALFQWGESLYNLQRFEEASTTYQQLLQESPKGEKRRLTLLRLGEIAYRAERYSEADSLLTLLLAEQPADDIAEVALYHLASTFLAQEKIDKARQTFETQLQRYPGGLFASFAKLSLGSALKQQEHYSEAIGLWQDVVKEVGGSDQPRIRNLAIEALYRLGEAYDTLGQYEDSAGAFARLASDYPDSSLLTASLYREAWAWFKVPKRDQAMQKAEQLLQRPGLTDLDQYRVGLRFLIGLVHFEAQAYDQAISAFQEVLALPRELNEWDQYAPKAQSQIVWACFQKGNYEAAGKEADRFEELFPGNPLAGDMQFVRAESLFKLERYEEASPGYQGLAEKFPQSPYIPEACFKAALCQMNLKHYEEASRLFAEFQQKHPDSQLVADASLMEAEALLSKQAYPEAIQAYQRFLRTYKEHPQVEYGLYQLAQCYRQTEAFDLLAEVCQEILKVNPESPHRPMALFWIAYRQDQQDHPQDAEEAYQALIRDYPHSEFAPEARLRLAMLQYRQNRSQEAAEQFQQLIQSDHPPKSIEPAIYFWTAAQLSSQKRYSEAIGIYSRLEDRFPRSDVIEEAAYRIGQCYSDSGDWANAEKAYGRAVKDFPEGPFLELSSLGLGLAELQLKAYDRAIERLTRLTQSQDTGVAARAGLALGDALAASGKKSDAVSAYLRVAFLYDHPEIVPECYWKAIEILTEQGNREQAEKHLKELMRLYPNNQYVKGPAPAAAVETATAAAEIAPATVEAATPLQGQ